MSSADIDTTPHNLLRNTRGAHVPIVGGPLCGLAHKVDAVLFVYTSERGAKHDYVLARGTHRSTNHAVIYEHRRAYRPSG